MINKKILTAQPSGAILKTEGSTIVDLVEKPRRKSATIKDVPLWNEKPPQLSLKLNGVERCSGLFTAMTANETMEEAKFAKPPRQLWSEFWFEGESCCLFADAGVGKSILAVQIANKISQTDKVLYYDLELSSIQFRKRYFDSLSQKVYKFSDNFIRPKLNREQLKDCGENMEELVFSAIENDVVRLGVKIVIVDNITWILPTKNPTSAAVKFMRRIDDLKNRLGLSVLILAHTNKRKMTTPLGQNDLSGSKKLINFFDSAFAIGKSVRDDKLRYVKQIKVRDEAEKYGESNVILYTVEKKNSFLQFIKQGNGNENDHLKVSKAEKQKEIARIKALHTEGKSVRDIAEIVGMSKSTVDRLLKG